MSVDARSPDSRRAATWSKYKPFRLLILIYGFAVPLACWEVLHGQQKVDLYLDPQANFTDTFYELYPNRGEARYEKAIQTLLCLKAETKQLPMPQACRKYESKDLRYEVRRTFERALETNIKTEEELFYSYLQVLVGSQAPKSKIDAAYRAWKRNYPLSALPDPRVDSGPKPAISR